ncbi:MAG TPA: ABC transporter substrate-binding protein, partial [Salinisphaeraceae bacterium]|nr:ABC transporter substrate-binding protein [Salinisphaeraceae bacterium]
GEHEQQDVADAVQENLPAGLVMLDISPAEDKDALVVTAETAEKHDLNSISDLQGVAENMVIGGPPELTKRADGLPGLKQIYGLKFKEFRSLDAGGPLTVGALEGGDIDIARMFTTQGIIKAKGWVVLEDDKDLVPAQNIVPVIRADAVNDDARAALNATSAALATDDLQELNRRVGVDEKAPDAVAAEWVENSGLAGGDEQ